MRFHFRPVAAALFLFVSACSGSCPGPESQTFLLVKSVDGTPVVLKQAAPTVGVLYIGVPFDGTVGGSDDGLNRSVSDGGMWRTGDLDISCDCNPPITGDGSRSRDKSVKVTSARLGFTVDVTYRGL
jgi:hypothetical protein